MTEPPARLAASLEGRYRVERELGEGGMATVYLAHDVRHDRKVALKVLRPELAALTGAERFLAEIRTTANLQHPHILPLFDSGQADGLVYYVMPYVPGESLRVRLDRERQLPVEEAVRIALAVAGALEHAHKQGVIHRDVKPANILLQDGEPVVSDFGIALAVSQAGGGRVTETGLSLGTPHYMSPEQASGEKTLDARTDVYALGCVLYEMLVGDPPHQGSSAQAVLARILTEDPRRVTEVRRSVPPNVEAAVSRALEKLPADRFESAEAFARALRDPAFRHEPAGVSPGVAPGQRLGVPSGEPISYRSRAPLFAASTLAVVASGALVWEWVRPAPAPPPEPVLRAFVEVSGRLSGFGRQLSISPDGEAVAYAAGAIYLRRAEDMEARQVPGTERGGQPVFSPDGRWIAFMRGDSLLKVGLDGGPPLLLARGFFLGMSWATNGSLYMSAAGPLQRVPEVGGAPELVLEPDTSGITYRWPELLPGGEALLFTALGSSVAESEIRLLELATGEMRTLVAPGTDPHYVPTGHIVYGHTDQALFALPFDLARHEVTGPPVRVLPAVGVGTSGATQFDVSANGSAVYVAGVSARDRLVMVDGRAPAEPLALPGGALRSVRFSPDGRRILFGTNIVGQVFVHDLALGTTLPVLPEGFNAADPFWSRDGRSITFHAARPDSTLGFDGFTAPADGSAPPRQLFRDAVAAAPLSWLPDGRLLARGTRAGQTWDDLWVLDFSGDSVRTTPYLRADWDERNAHASPDGRWVAFLSNETGPHEVYVRPFPDASAGKWQISEDGGSDPVWAPDGGTLYYWKGSELRAARLRTRPDFAVLARETVLTDDSYVPSCCYPNYDVHPDGRRFVMARSSGDEARPGFVIVVNWFEELRQRMGAGAGAGGG